MPPVWSGKVPTGFGGPYIANEDGFQIRNIFKCPVMSLQDRIQDFGKTFFSKLSEGGKVSHELRQEFWGATFGVLTDKYGIRWMLNYDETHN